MNNSPPSSSNTSNIGDKFSHDKSVINNKEDDKLEESNCTIVSNHNRDVYDIDDQIQSSCISRFFR